MDVEKAMAMAVASSAASSADGERDGERDGELEQRRLEDLGTAAAEGEAPSLPSGVSSGSAAFHRQNPQLEKHVGRLGNHAIHAYKAPAYSADLHAPAVWSEGSVQNVTSHQMFPSVKSRDEKIRQLELKKMLREANELDLAFLVDATSSMRGSIDEVKTLIPNIATEIKKAFPKLKMRVAFAPYRDYDEFDQDEAEKCDFTDSFEGPESVFVTAVSKVRATGGADFPEDVFSGLERVASLSWSSKTRVLIHIGDAPCHGREFHNLEDSFSGGDSKGRDIRKLLAALRNDCHIVHYLFCHITEYTKKMLKVFRERAPQGGWIHEEKLGGINKLLEVVVSSSCKSIAVSTRTVSEGPFMPRYMPVIPTTIYPTWSTIHRKKAVQFSYIVPATLENLFKIVDNNGSLVLERTRATTVKIAYSPFTAEGNMRWPYHAIVHRGLWKSPTRMVVKRFKQQVGEDSSKVHAMEAYCEQMEVQTVAAFLAEHFNDELKKLPPYIPYKTVQFTAVSVLQVGGSLNYNMEVWLEGRWIRYSNNVNYVNTKEYADTLHAFSHWTYQRSKGLLMVTDLQGVQVDGGKNGKSVFMLCDPAVHCKHPYRYGRTKTNWSTAGMECFFETHRCNIICKNLNLEPNPSSFTPDDTGVKGSLSAA